MQVAGRGLTFILVAGGDSGATALRSTSNTATVRFTCATALAVAILCVSASAQTNPNSTSQGAVCPLSDAQTQKSIDAFAKLVPTFTQEPRCVNCHGGVDPFSKPTNHGGDTQELGSDCNDCHSEMPPKRGGQPSRWRLANQNHFFKGKDAKTLCEQMRDAFPVSADFIGHLIDDNGNSKFTETAFLGTRGLNERGRNLVDNYVDEPPKLITHGGLINFGMDWINAMGGEFKGDIDCGCEPSHYAVRVTYDQDITMPMTHFTKKMGPIDIPITFRDDGSFEGEQTVFFNGNGVAYVCTGESISAMNLRVFGNATEQFQKNQMELKMENGSPLRGTASGHCPALSRTVQFAGGQQGELGKTLPGRVGDTAMWMPSVAVPGIRTIIHAEIVKMK